MNSERARLGALLCAMGLLAAACSGTGGVDEEFCDEYAHLSVLTGTGPGEDDPEVWIEETSATMAAVQQVAPDEIADAVNGVVEGLTGPVEALDEEAFFALDADEQYQADSTALETFAIDGCGWDAIEVTAINYGFETDFDDVSAGTLAFQFHNAGTEIHEMALIRINDDVDESIEELIELPEEESETMTQFIGIAFGAPGAADTLIADVEPGRYAVLCFLPVGSTDMEALESGAANGPPHFTVGMVEEFTVDA
jgi:hypothetical protein